VVVPLLAAELYALSMGHTRAAGAASAEYEWGSIGALPYFVGAALALVAAMVLACLRRQDEANAAAGGDGDGGAAHARASVGAASPEHFDGLEGALQKQEEGTRKQAQRGE
jgi:hypothetical protein